MDRYIANILILSVMISSVAADSLTPKENEPKILYYQYATCPPVGHMNQFELTTLYTTTKMFGCAYLGFDKPNSLGPLFHLFVENPQVVVDHSIDMRGSCDQTEQMDHFVFECLDRYLPTDKEENQKDWQYTSLQEYTADDQNGNFTPTNSYRCALFNVIDDLGLTARSIRMVISKPVTGEAFNVSQCEGLSALMGREDLPMLPKGMRNWPDGSMLLYLLGIMPGYYEITTESPLYMTNPITKWLLEGSEEDKITLKKYIKNKN